MARSSTSRGTTLKTAVLAAAAAALLGVAATPAVAESSNTTQDTSQFRGANWAAPGDNYADGPVVLSGLSLSDDYATTYQKAARIVDAFRATLGANTIRIPINPYTVNGTYWNAYRAVFDAATDRGFKVIASYWEGTVKDGRIDAPAADYWHMWTTVTGTYQLNPRVYFEPMNEPFGYTPAQWADLAAQWLNTFPAIPRDRVFVSGSGYNDHVTSVCADSRLNGTYLSLHHYGYWGNRTYDQWVADFKNRVGTCASRTVVDEFGAAMTTGLDYDAPANGNNMVAFMQADTDTLRALHMGSVYWPGLRTGDTYSLENLVGDPIRPWLAVTNQSGADRLAWAWGRGRPARES